MPKPVTDEDKTKEQLIKELEQMRDQMSRMDVLANSGTVHNLTYFLERLAEELSRSSRYKYSFAIVIVEVDNFGVYSKKCGSAASNELLSMLQTILRNALRLSDLYCHFENSKFGLLLPYTESDGAGIITGRIIQTTERTLALKSMAAHIPITASAGIAVFPRDAVSEKILFELANIALQRSREKGGNYCTFASAEESGVQNAASFVPEHTGNEALLEFLDDEIQRCSRYSTELSLMLVSLSEIEQGGGLTALLDRRRVMPIFDDYISGCIRGTDRQFLYSGSRLAVLLPNTNAAGAQVLAGKMLQSISDSTSASTLEKGAKLSLNIGIASFPIDEVSRNGLIRCAEAASALALKKGKNQVVLASSLVRPEGGNQRDITAWIESLRDMGQNSIYNLIAVVDAIEHYIVPHSQNTAKLSVTIGQALGLNPANIRKLRVMSLLHDLGKVRIAPGIITKAGPVDAKEWGIMKKHPEFGAIIVQQFPDFAYASKAILAHHERMDGKGYPAGLAGEQIPLESRIIAVAEAFDDMVTPRPYREHLSLREALKEIVKCAGSQFDPVVVSALKKVVPNTTSG